MTHIEKIKKLITIEPIIWEQETDGSDYWFSWCNPSGLAEGIETFVNTRCFWKRGWVAPKDEDPVGRVIYLNHQDDVFWVYYLFTDRIIECQRRMEVDDTGVMGWAPLSVHTNIPKKGGDYEKFIDSFLSKYKVDQETIDQYYLGGGDPRNVNFKNFVYRWAE